tara:strand:+ start:99 stop:983 length:885 start_codon:yes stop_codon:yes gene_type:complete
MNTLINANESNYFSLLKPRKSIQKPFIITSSHSGTLFPHSFNPCKEINAKVYMSMQDMFVNDLSLNMNELGITVLQSNISRLVIDLNRNITEIDPKEIINVPKGFDFDVSSKTRSGIGLVPTNDSLGNKIYNSKISWGEVEKRIKKFYSPWHHILKKEIDKLYTKFGYVFVIDLHSMPSKDINGKDLENFVIGNNFDKTSTSSSRIKLSRFIKEKGYSFSFNYPYTGGFICNKYSLLEKNIECIQIEISKKLYMSEEKIEKNENFYNFKDDLNYIIDSFKRDFEAKRSHNLAAE